jgi:hypothetical protein
MGIGGAHLENLPIIKDNLLNKAGDALGSRLVIPSSEVNCFSFSGDLQKSKLLISSMQITGSALQMGLAGSVDFSSGTLNLKGPLGLTREAIEDCGAKKVALKDGLANPNDLYVKIPGRDVEVYGPLEDPKVDYSGVAVAMRVLLNFGASLLQGTGDAANGAAGSALGAPGSILQGVGNLFKGF